MQQLQGWISGITIPRYAANVEGGGGKIVLMPSGHDTLNVQAKIDDKISESFAGVSTWDGRIMYRYEALGRTDYEEFKAGVKIMDDFIGREKVFLPKLIIVDDNGNHLETTNRTKLPKLKTLKKAELLEYDLYVNDMPLTNPADAAEELEAKFRASAFNQNII
jgi:lysine 2,3-aminomutase